MIHSKQQGFTIIELMIATTIFSTVLVICASALLVVGKQLHKADISVGTQNSARAVIDEVSQQLRLSRSTPIKNAGAICIGSVRYSFQLGVQVTSTSSPQALWRDVISDENTCVSVSLAPGIGGKELLPLHTRLVSFDVNNGNSGGSPYPTNKLWNVDASILYGDDEALNPAHTNCLAISQGGTYCALSELHTAVFRSVN